MARKRATPERRTATRHTIAGRDMEHWKVVFGRWIRSGEHSSHAIGDVVTYWRHLPVVLRKSRDAGGSGKATPARLAAGVLMAWWDQAHGHLANRAQEMAHSSNRDAKEHDTLMRSARLAHDLLTAQPGLMDKCDTWPEAGYEAQGLSSKARSVLDDTVPVLEALLTWERRKEHESKGGRAAEQAERVTSSQKEPPGYSREECMEARESVLRSAGEGSTGDLNDWLWRLECVEKALRTLPGGSEVHVAFTLGCGPAINAATEDTFPFGDVLLMYSTRRLGGFDKYGCLWYDLGNPAIPFALRFCFEEESLSAHDSVPEITIPGDDERAHCGNTLCWNTWYYLPGKHGDECHVFTEDWSLRLTDLEGAICECSAVAPKGITDKIGKVHTLRSWPDALLYLSLKRIHPLLTGYGNYLRRPARRSVENLNARYIELSPDFVTATSYALDAFRQAARSGGEREPVQVADSHNRCSGRCRAGETDAGGGVLAAAAGDRGGVSAKPRETPKRGRPRESDPVKDREIYGLWEQNRGVGGCRTYQELSLPGHLGDYLQKLHRLPSADSVTGYHVGLAIGRHRHHVVREKNKRRTNSSAE